MTTPEADDRAPLIRYLLGQMRPEEQALVEERYLADPDYHDELRAAERDLIDRYVRGELSEPDAFERQYLSSPGRRAKVEFARALAQWSDRSPVAAVPAERRARLLHGGLPRFSRPWQMAAAASIILAGSWFVVARRGQGPVKPGTGSGSGLVHAPPSPAPPPSNRSQAGPPVAVAAFVLMPNLSRAGGAMPTLVLTAGTDVRLQLGSWNRGITHGTRRSSRTAGGQNVWREDRLEPTPSSSGPGLVLTIPATRLVDDDYTVRVGGVTPGGEIEDLSGYTFRVRIR